MMPVNHIKFNAKLNMKTLAVLVLLISNCCATNNNDTFPTTFSRIEPYGYQLVNTIKSEDLNKKYNFTLGKRTGPKLDDFRVLTPVLVSIDLPKPCDTNAVMYLDVKNDSVYIIVYQFSNDIHSDTIITLSKEHYQELFDSNIMLDLSLANKILIATQFSRGKFIVEIYKIINKTEILLLESIESAYSVMISEDFSQALISRRFIYSESSKLFQEDVVIYDFLNDSIKVIKDTHYNIKYPRRFNKNSNLYYIKYNDSISYLINAEPSMNEEKVLYFVLQPERIKNLFFYDYEIILFIVNLSQPNQLGREKRIFIKESK